MVKDQILKSKKNTTKQTWFLKHKIRPSQDLKQDMH